MINKKKAFTLTELLVVVIVIGVLSAVVLPKFSKVVETRKTTEAEEVMAAIRTEQEARCALNKQYTTDFTSFIENGDVKLAAIPGDTSKAESNNFTYTLTGRRITAASKDKAYTLQMPSLADGRVSCGGAYCSQLNKDYPTRTELESRSDFMNASLECGPTDTCDDDEVGDTSTSCECTGTRSHACNTTTGVWEWGECVGGSAASLRNVTYTPAGKGPADCATRTEKQICAGNAWTWDNFEITASDESACQTLQCTPGANAGTVPCNECGEKTKTCDSNGFWTYGSCTATSQTQTGGSCTTNGYAGTYVKTCGSNGYWSSTQTCRCNAGETRTETVSCGSGYTGNKTRTCTCNSDGTETCDTTWNTSNCSAIECTANDPNVACTPDSSYPSNCGKKTHYCDTVTKKWKTGSAAYSACSPTSSCCGTAPSADSCTCTNGYPGTQQWSCTSTYGWKYHYDGCGACTPINNGCSENNKPTGSCCISSGNCGCYPSTDIGGNGYVMPAAIKKDFDDTWNPNWGTYNAEGRMFSFYYAEINHNCPSGTVWSCGCSSWGTWKNCSCVTGTWSCTCSH